MWISNIDIKKFRNYDRESISFSNGLNYVYGRNSAGKTNLLEAIDILSHGKSMRLRNSEDLIMDGNSSAFLSGSYHDEKKNNLAVNCALTKNSGKRISVNGKMVTRISDVFRLAPTVQCFENDTLLLQGPPAIRRNFLDCLCAQLYPSYLAHHREFREILGQRNSALKNQTLHGKLKEAIDEVFINRSIPLVQLRQETLKRLSLILNKQASSFEEEADFAISEASLLQSIEVQDLSNFMYDKMKKLSIEESRFCRTSTGPHKDSFDLIQGVRKIKWRSSRGQVKNMIFRLKMAEYDLLKTELGISPIILLDDVFAEMDNVRQGNMAKLLQLGAQVFLASTGTSPAIGKQLTYGMRKIEIVEGVVVRNDVILSAA
jgi:DNA replication and repair protein RecF